MADEGIEAEINKFATSVKELHQKDPTKLYMIGAAILVLFVIIMKMVS